jgi:lysozyme
MSALEILLKLIRDSEGCKLTAYQCPSGVWTVGYGYTGADIKKGVTWTQEKADECLLVTAMAVLDRAIKYSPILATANMEKQAAIADFIYNLGVGNYSKSTLKKQVDAGNWMAASSEIKKWNKAAGKELKGLTIRRQKEAALLMA